jgi:2-polyprenyl-6-methoxyphenol hydroxylase-like FAD-dependent oxidoreductase
MAGDRRTALIVGAGIGGLAAGIAMRQAGWDVRIIESAPVPRELGFGIALAPNASAALRALGVADPVVRQRITPVRAELRNGEGRTLRRLRIPADLVGRIEDPPSAVLRPVLHGALLDAVGADALSLGSAVTRFEVDGMRPAVRCADGRTVSGDVLIGADGVGSVIRTQLHPAEAPPAPSGYVALRGLSPAVDALDGLQFIGYFGPGLEVGVAQVAAHAIYWYVSLLAADVPAGLTDARAILRRVQAPLDAQFQTIADATPAEDLRFDVLMRRDPLTQWGDGPVTLLGDAAHPMLPHTGQGAAQALEDAVALGLALRHGGDPVHRLRAYEQVRSQRTRKIVALGPRIAAVTTTRNRAVGLVRNAVIRFAPDRAMVAAFLQTAAAKDPHAALR